MVGHRWLIGLGLCMLGMSVSASAETKSYTLRGDSSTLFPTDGTMLRPGTVSGNVGDRTATARQRARRGRRA